MSDHDTGLRQEQALTKRKKRSARKLRDRKPKRQGSRSQTGKLLPASFLHPADLRRK